MRRDDIRAAAAYADIHNGFYMAIKGLRELTKEDPRDEGDDELPLIVAVERISQRAARWARKKVTARVDDAVPSDVYLIPGAEDSL